MVVHGNKRPHSDLGPLLDDEEEDADDAFSSDKTKPAPRPVGKIVSSGPIRKTGNIVSSTSNGNKRIVSSDFSESRRNSEFAVSRLDKGKGMDKGKGKGFPHFDPHMKGKGTIKGHFDPHMKGKGKGEIHDPHLKGGKGILKGGLPPPDHHGKAHGKGHDPFDPLGSPHLGGGKPSASTIPPPPLHHPGAPPPPLQQPGAPPPPLHQPNNPPPPREPGRIVSSFRGDGGILNQPAPPGHHQFSPLPDVVLPPAGHLPPGNEPPRKQLRSLKKVDVPMPGSLPPSAQVRDHETRSFRRVGDDSGRSAASFNDDPWAPPGSSPEAGPTLSELINERNRLDNRPKLPPSLPESLDIHIAPATRTPPPESNLLSGSWHNDEHERASAAISALTGPKENRDYFSREKEPISSYRAKEPENAFAAYRPAATKEEKFDYDSALKVLSDLGFQLRVDGNTQLSRQTEDLCFEVRRYLSERPSNSLRF